MTLLAALGGGLLGTILLASALQGATALHISRIDLPFLLGTLFTADRGRAKAIGYAMQVAVGLLFATIYWGLMRAIETDAWWAGTALGLIHGLATVTFLIPIMLPAIHPRLGSAWTCAREAPTVAEPGNLMLSYGSTTPAVTIAGHVLYGTTVALFAGAAA